MVDWESLLRSRIENAKMKFVWHLQGRTLAEERFGRSYHVCMIANMFIRVSNRCFCIVYIYARSGDNVPFHSSPVETFKPTRSTSAQANCMA